MARNSVQLIRFGQNVFDFFSSNYETKDYFFLSIDSKIFEKLVSYKYKIDKESLIENLADTGFDFELVQGDENGLIAIAIATYQVLLASESKGTKSREAFKAFYNKVPNEKIIKIWSASKEYFYKHANIFLCLPSYDNAN